MDITLLRHTTPDIAPGTCYGRTDLEVAASFHDEAAAVAAALPRFDRIVSSPLQRCRRLATFLGETHGLPVVDEPRVQEMDFGRWEGKLWSDLPRPELDAWAADFLNANPHGGETVAILQARVRDALAHWRDAATRTLIVTHSGVIRAALATGETASDFSANIDFGGFISISSAEAVKE